MTREIVDADLRAARLECIPPKNKAEKIVNYKCPVCGHEFTLTNSEEQYCPYCGDENNIKEAEVQEPLRVEDQTVPCSPAS